MKNQIYFLILSNFHNAVFSALFHRLFSNWNLKIESKEITDIIFYLKILSDMKSLKYLFNRGRVSFTAGRLLVDSTNLYESQNGDIKHTK